jgi:hypothetical protein
MLTETRTTAVTMTSWLAVRPTRATPRWGEAQLPTSQARYRRRQRAFLARAVPGAFEEWKGHAHPDQGLRLRAA